MSFSCYLKTDSEILDHIENKKQKIEVEEVKNGIRVGWYGVEFFSLKKQIEE